MYIFATLQDEGYFNRSLTTALYFLFMVKPLYHVKKYLDLKQKQAHLSRIREKICPIT